MRGGGYRAGRLLLGLYDAVGRLHHVGDTVPLPARMRAEVEAYWGRPAATVSTRPGLTAVEMSRALEAGRLKAIWIAATNPAVSLPDLHQVRRALSRAELIVVQDSYHPTETTRLADVILPVAQWGEKEWTSTNSERMIGYSPKLWNPPGEALPDWQILARFAQTARRESQQSRNQRYLAGNPCGFLVQC